MRMRFAPMYMYMYMYTHMHAHLYTGVSHFPNSIS